MEESNNNESFAAGEDTERLVPDRSSSDVPQPPHNTSADELGAGPDASGKGRCCLWELCCGEETPQCRARLKGVGIAVSILSLIGFIVSAVMVAGAYESILHNLLQTVSTSLESHFLCFFFVIHVMVSQVVFFKRLVTHFLG